MRKASSLALSIVLLVNITGCSKSTEEAPITSRVLSSDDAISIETFTTENGNEVIETLPTFEVHVPEYQVKECELDIDTDNHTIKGQYVDMHYTIDIDLTYHDYDVNEVSIYKVVKANAPGQISVDLTGTDWEANRDDPMGAIHTLSNDERRRELAVQSALSYEYGLVDSNEDLMEIVSIINKNGEFDIAEAYICYDYPIAEMNDRIIISDPDLLDFYELHSDVEHVNFVTLRTELDGLPLGIPCDNDHWQPRVRYGDYYGSFPGGDDFYTTGFYKSSTCTQIDFIYPFYDAELVEGTTASVISLEDCILNGIPAAIFRYGLGDCHIYAAELIYIPFMVGENGEGLILDKYIIPVWAVYMVSVGTPYSVTEATTIYINATTGELVSYGM